MSVTELTVGYVEFKAHAPGGNVTDTLKSGCSCRRIHNMTDNITLNDGTVSRTYNSRGRVALGKDGISHVRKTDERDASPEILFTKFEQTGLNTRAELSFLKTKVDSVTGKSYTKRTSIVQTGDVAHFTQAECEADLIEAVAALAISGFKSDFVFGKM